MGNDDVITLRGDREVWLEFTHQVKRQKKQVWDVLAPLLREYIKKNK